jgi:hypothetical protein
MWSWQSCRFLGFVAYLSSGRILRGCARSGVGWRLLRVSILPKYIDPMLGTLGGHFQDGGRAEIDQLLLYIYIYLWGWTRSLVAYCTSPRWWWLWSDWWKEDWQGKPKYSEEKTSHFVDHNHLTSKLRGDREKLSGYIRLKGRPMRNLRLRNDSNVCRNLLP